MWKIPDAIYLGAGTGGVQFAFSRMESRYQQSGIFHYRGMAILPMRPQIIDCEGYQQQQIVCNSIPIWLQMKNTRSVYPSYLVPQNLHPPYIQVDVRNSIPLQVAPVVFSGGAVPASPGFSSPDALRIQQQNGAGSCELGGEQGAGGGKVWCNQYSGGSGRKVGTG